MSGSTKIIWKTQNTCEKIDALMFLEYPVPFETQEMSLLDHLGFDNTFFAAQQLKQMDDDRITLRDEMNPRTNKDTLFIGGENGPCQLFILAERCFKEWYTLTRIVENNRSRYQIKGCLLFSWSSLGVTYSTTCFRFETIGLALLYGILLFNRSVYEQSIEQKNYKDHLLNAYIVFRYICYEQMCMWEQRDESEIPYLFTERGILCLLSLCSIKMQSDRIIDYLDNTEKESKDKKKEISSLAKWSQYEISTLDHELTARKLDGTLKLYLWKNQKRNFIQEYRDMSVVFFLVGLFFYITEEAHEDITIKISICTLINNALLKHGKRRYYQKGDFNFNETLKSYFKNMKDEHTAMLGMTLITGPKKKKSDSEHIKDMLNKYRIEELFNNDELFAQTQKIQLNNNMQMQDIEKKLRFNY